MKPKKTDIKDNYLKIRLSNKDKNNFKNHCKKRKMKMSEVLEKMIKQVVANGNTA